MKSARQWWRGENLEIITLINFEKNVSILWRKTYFGARFHFQRSGKVKLYNTEIAGKIRLNEEKDYVSIGKSLLVTHSAGLLAIHSASIETV